MDSNILFLAQYLRTIWTDSLAEQVDKPSWSQSYYVRWHQAKVAVSSEAVLDCLCFPNNWKSRESGYLTSWGIYIFPWKNHQLFKDRRKKKKEKEKVIRQTNKIKIKNQCVGAFPVLQSISLKITYIEKYMCKLLFFRDFFCLSIIYGLLVFLQELSVLFSVIFYLNLQVFPKRSVTFLLLLLKSESNIVVGSLAVCIIN